MAKKEIRYSAQARENIRKGVDTLADDDIVPTK